MSADAYARFRVRETPIANRSISLKRVILGKGATDAQSFMRAHRVITSDERNCRREEECLS